MPPNDNDGLLSRVVRFVRSPGSNSATSEAQDSENESGYSKQMLKEMIERKRHNDFVRKREFEALRKMRRSEVMAGHDPAARPSFFQSSLPSRPDDRASTLKKIDEIEAQMSMQWWKSKHGDVTTRAAAFPLSSHVPPEMLANPATAPAPAYTRTDPLPLAAAPREDQRTHPLPIEPLAPVAPARASASSPAAAPQGRTAGASSGLAPLSSTRAAALAPQAAAAPAAKPAAQPAPAPADPPPSGFSASKFSAIDIEEFAHDPELEEAAIRFANGDNEGAEAGLMEVLVPTGSRINHEETWLTLFDLYRSTGQQARFDEAAIEFANRFGRSAPQWLSLPEVVDKMKPAPVAPANPAQVADWTCPSSLGTQTLAALQAVLGRVAQPWRLSWVKLTTIDEGAIEGLTKLMAQWASSPVQLRFIEADTLERVLKNATPSGDPGVNPAWWKLRMETLRVMHRPDEFELVALDYCVTYEVSPPSWESTKCEYKPLQADGTAVAGHTIIGDAFQDSMMAGGYADSNVVGGHSQMASTTMNIELTGYIVGDATQALETLDAKLAGADVMVISCTRLIRIDFSAAGSLLNWVSARQTEGRQVQFVDVHRLVAAFFNVIGISEHARVVVRRD